VPLYRLHVDAVPQRLKRAEHEIELNACLSVLYEGDPLPRDTHGFGESDRGLGLQAQRCRRVGPIPKSSADFSCLRP